MAKYFLSNVEIFFPRLSPACPATPSWLAVLLDQPCLDSRRRTRWRWWRGPGWAWWSTSSRGTSRPAGLTSHTDITSASSLPASSLSVTADSHLPFIIKIKYIISRDYRECLLRGIFSINCLPLNSCSCLKIMCYIKRKC